MSATLRVELDVGAAIMRGDKAPVPGFRNFRARLMVAYLMNHEQMSFEEIVARPPDPWTVHGKVAAILNRDPPALLDRLERPR